MRRFCTTPYYTGADDRSATRFRGTLRLGETVVVESWGP